MAAVVLDPVSAPSSRIYLSSPYKSDVLVEFQNYTRRASDTSPVPFTCSAFSPDGSLLSLADKKNNVWLVRVEQGECTLVAGGLGAGAVGVGALAFTQSTPETKLSTLVLSVVLTSLISSVVFSSLLLLVVVLSFTRLLP